MKIGYFSDLHLEASNVVLDFSAYDCLIFAGDISADFFLLEQFLSYKVPHNIPVIFVPGNHEFEGKEFNFSIKSMEDIFSQYENMHFLYNKSIVIDNIQFLGTTLWTNFESMGLQYKEDVKKIVKTNVADFRYILKIEDKKYVSWNPEDMEKEFQKSYDFLSFHLKNTPENVEHKIVVTHFAPHRKSVPAKYAHDLISSYSSNDLDNVMGFSDYWIHGHIHNSSNYEVYGTKVLCNPRGYGKIFNLHQNSDFDSQSFINLDSITDLKNNKKIKP